jgi:hypothetical protein
MDKTLFFTGRLALAQCIGLAETTHHVHSKASPPAPIPVDAGDLDRCAIMIFSGLPVPGWEERRFQLGFSPVPGYIRGPSGYKLSCGCPIIIPRINSFVEELRLVLRFYSS